MMNFAEFIEELLACFKCTIPMTSAADCCMLPCRHSFCRNCLNDIFNLRALVRCPICDQHFRTPVDQYPPAPELLQLIELLASIQQLPEESATPGQYQLQDDPFDDDLSDDHNNLIADSLSRLRACQARLDSYKFDFNQEDVDFTRDQDYLDSANDEPGELLNPAFGA